MFSFTLDIDNAVSGSINGYARLWGWSKNKTRKFLKEIRSGEGHRGDQIRSGYGLPVHFIDKGLWGDRNRIATGSGLDKDQVEDTTTNPNHNNNNNSDSRNQKSPPCLHQAIIQIFLEELPQLPRVKPNLWGGKRKKALQARWREDVDRQRLEWWRDYFQRVARTPFLLGENDRGWTADIEWLLSQANMAKVLEGKYNRREARTGSDWH